MSTLIERLRSVRTGIYPCEHHSLLCEEAAREIERLVELADTYRQASEFLGGSAAQSIEWPDDT